MTPASCRARPIETLSAWLFCSGLASAGLVTTALAFCLPTGRWLSHEATLTCLAFIWSMYLLDRLKSAPEDAGRGDASAGGFVARRRRLFVGLAAALALAQVACIVAMPRLGLWTLGALLVSSLYVLKIPVLGRRVKDIPFVKPFYLGTVYALLAWGIVVVDGDTARTGLGPFAFVVVVFGVNAALYDLKDAAADRRAGIRTFANTFSHRTFLAGAGLVLLALVLSSSLLLPAHLMQLGLVSLALYAVALLALRRRPFDMTMSAAIDGGHAAAVILVWLASSP